MSVRGEIYRYYLVTNNVNSSISYSLFWTRITYTNVEKKNTKAQKKRR